MIKPCSPPAKDAKAHGMSEPNAPKNAFGSEDRRRPRALMPYAVLWATCLVCVIFAVFELLQQA